MLEIYTDGACIPNPGKGGWAFVAVKNGRVIYSEQGKENQTTNNRMEFMGVICALEWLKEPAIVHSDSQLVVNIANERWRSRKNTDLALRVQKLVKAKKAKIVWVRGHDGNRFNELADQLANHAVLVLKS